MIKTFRHKGLKRFHDSGTTASINPQHAKRLRLILGFLEAATVLEELNFPGSRLHLLKGNRRGYWSVRVTGNHRVTFRFADGDVYDVDYEDCH